MLQDNVEKDYTIFSMESSIFQHKDGLFCV